MNRFSEIEKIDLGLEAQALSNTNATGVFYSMAGFRRALALLNVAAMAATKTCKIELLQATDADGTDSTAVTGAEATITANEGVAEATVDLTSVGTADTVTIVNDAGEDVTFTQASGTEVEDREFVDAAGLVLCVNDADYGVSGVTAEANGAVVTLTPTIPGSGTITVSRTDVGGTITLATVKAQAYVEIEDGALDHPEFTHVAVKVTTTATTVVAATLLRGAAIGGLTQAVGASASL